MVYIYVKLVDNAIRFYRNKKIQNEGSKMADTFFNLWYDSIETRYLRINNITNCEYFVKTEEIQNGGCKIKLFIICVKARMKLSRREFFIYDNLEN